MADPVSYTHLDVYKRQGSDAVENPGARATINDEDGTGSFSNGDETTIMGFVYEAMPPVKKESPATYKDGTWTTTMTWDEFGEGAHVAFSAFFPKLSLSDFSELGQMAINLPTDQSTTEQYADCDWLHAVANGCLLYTLDVYKRQTRRR